MTNLIQFPSSIGAASLNSTSASKLGSVIGNSSFNDLFSTFLTDINSTSGLSENNESSSDLISSMLMMMFFKLFGDDASTSKMTADAPKGYPVTGVLTQTSHEGHVALDFGVAVGTNVKTTMEGKVTFAGWTNEGYGNLVIVKNGNYETYYAHLSSIPVKVGQSVDEGEIIGLSGNTGNSTGPHLHYEIKRNGIAINPLTTLNNS